MDDNQTVSRILAYAAAFPLLVSTAGAAYCGEKRIAKGGSWGTLAHNLRTADRFPYPPGHRDDSIGIRVAKTLTPPAPTPPRVQ